MAKKKTFSKLRNHLTSTELDEKAAVLENISRMPTNNTAFVFSGDPSNPQGNSFETIIDGETDETDYNVGESPTSSTEARDTTGLFNAGGNHAAGEYVKTVEPPGDTSYILGPMAAMYYTWSYPWTMIGYIRESDRRMVNLARIDGKLSDWDQSSGFSSYGQLTLDQAKWFFNIQKAFGNSNDPDTYSYRAFYPGPPSQTADAYGRYPCILTGVSKQKPNTHPDSTPLDKQSGDNYSAMQAQADKGSGFISFKPDLDWYKKNKKKPKGAPSDWNNMSDDEKANWISQNQPEERFDYQDGRFRPNQNNAQSDSNRVVNPYSIFDPSQDPLGDIPLSQQFNIDSPLGDFDPNANFGTGRDGTFGTGTSGKGMPSNPDFRGAGNNKNTSSINTTKAGGPLSKYTSEQQDQIRKFRARGDLKGEIKYVSEIQLAAKSDAYQKGELSTLGQVEYRAHQLFHNINNILSPVTNFTDKFNSIVGPVVGLKGAPTTIIGRIAKPIISTTLGKTSQLGTTLFSPADNGLSYNLQHATGLVSSIITGKPVQVKVSGKLRNEAISNINADKISNNIRFGPPTPISAEKTIRPDNKGDIFNDGNLMGVIGGYEFSVDGDTFTLSGQKMLRTDEANPVTKNEKGKIIRFKDIPEIEDKDLGPVVERLVTEPGLVNSLIQKGAKVGDFLVGNDDPRYSVYNSIKNDPEALTELVDEITEKVNSMKIGSKASDAIQGTASNSVAVRNILTRLGFPKSQAEKEGKGYGQVYTTITGNINELPLDVQNAIKAKRNSGVKESLSLERKREIFGHLTQPVVLPETKQKTYKVSPGQRYKDKNKKPEKTNFQDMDKLFNKNIGGPQPFKPQERTSWTKDFINQNVIKSQEKMNSVLELIGDGKFALDHAMNDYKKMGAKELEQYWGKNPNMYSFLFNGKKYNVTRKEHVEGDSVVFMEDQQGVKSNMLQSELNEKLEEQNEKWIKEAYFKSHPVIPEKKESTYELIKRRFLENKKIAPEFPAEPPPEMVNGYHPKFGKRAARYKKLDPASANAMPLTGDPETDEIVRKQKTINKIKSMKKK